MICMDSAKNGRSQWNEEKKFEANGLINICATPTSRDARTVLVTVKFINNVNVFHFIH